MTASIKDRDYSTDASDAVIKRLHQLHPKVIDLSLDRLLGLLDRLGNPHKKLPPVIHVAGTNGKGSVTATVRAIAEAAGHRVHVYTSPHLVRFHERIRLAGQLIGEDELTDLLEEVEIATKGHPITFFEVTTAAAFLAFSRVPADLVILEVGLGGRLDATNVIDKPIATAITPIDLDHQQFLGDTLEQIASEKAGILKSRVPAIIAPQAEDAKLAIRKRAKKIDAPLYSYGAHWRIQISDDGESFRYEDRQGSLKLPRPTLRGRHQFINAATAIAALRHQAKLKITDAAIRAGLGWVRWPARMQPLDNSILAEGMPEGTSLLLDGGHNPLAGEILRLDLKKLDPVEQPITLIIGMMARKDIEGFFRPLTGLGAQVIGIPIPGHDGAATAAEVAAAATNAGMPGYVAKDIWGALERVKADHKEGTRPTVLIGGSLYLAGHILKEINQFPE